jgi:hypothetical protein
MKTKSKMNCPQCGSEISVDELLVKQFQESIKKDLELELRKRESELESEKKEFKKLSDQLTKDKGDVDYLINSRVQEQLRSAKDALKDSIRKEISEEKSKQLQTLEDELVKKSAQLREMNGTKAQLERLRREMEEAETRITLEKEKELTERLEQVRSTIKEQVQQESFLKLKEREKIIEDLKMKLNDAKRLSEQGSMQLQGDIQELEIIEMLQEMHPYDGITQSKKGANGADILQVVRTQNGAECGKIYYESKNTKSFSSDWIKKLKQDNLIVKADLLVLVTAKLPNDADRFTLIDGVWVCTFEDVKHLAIILRYGLLKLQSVAIAKQGQESKMELLYSYLTSEEFKNVFEQILAGFKEMQDSHHSEKLKMHHLWKQREKVLERVLANSVNFYGSLRGISNSVPEMPMLESPSEAA